MISIKLITFKILIKTLLDKLNIMILFSYEKDVFIFNNDKFICLKCSE